MARLVRSENVGPATFRELINHFGSAQAALEALPTMSRRGGAADAQSASAGREEAEAELEAAKAQRRLHGRASASRIIRPGSAMPTRRRRFFPCAAIRGT